MNEKIRELRQQATIIVGAESGFAFDREVLDEEKFAELIVRRVISVYNDSETFKTSYYDDSRVLEHFGVEE